MALPPELVHKGRLDAIFFGDLFSLPIREPIFRIHLSNRKYVPEQFNLKLLAEACEGFPGAGIEQAVLLKIYAVLGHDKPLDEAMLLHESTKTYPLSVTRG